MKSIKGYEGEYSITKSGKVWSFPKNLEEKHGRFHNGKWLKPWKDTAGYWNAVIGDKPVLEDKHVRQIRKLREQGKSVKEICSLMNVSMWRVYDLLEGRSYKNVY